MPGVQDFCVTCRLPLLPATSYGCLPRRLPPCLHIPFCRFCRLRSLWGLGFISGVPFHVGPAILDLGTAPNSPPEHLLANFYAFGLCRYRSPATCHLPPRTWRYRLFNTAGLFHRYANAPRFCLFCVSLLPAWVPPACACRYCLDACSRTCCRFAFVNYPLRLPPLPRRRGYKHLRCVLRLGLEPHLPPFHLPFRPRFTYSFRYLLGAFHRRFDRYLPADHHRLPFWMEPYLPAAVLGFACIPLYLEPATSPVDPFDVLCHSVPASPGRNFSSPALCLYCRYHFLLSL